MRMNFRDILPASGLAALLALGAALPGSASAGSASANLSVTATVAASCSIATAPVSFGTYDPTGAGNLNATGSVSITCTLGAIPTITLGLGANASGATRRMSNGTSYIEYELYQPSTVVAGAPCAYTQVWGTSGLAVFTPVAAISNATRTYNVCGQAAQGQNVTTGTYTDTVTATVNF